MAMIRSHPSIGYSPTGGRRAADAGVVHRDVQSPVRLHRTLDQGLGRVRLRHIGSQDLSLSPGPFDLFQCVLRTVDVYVREHDRRSALGEPNRDGLAKAGAGASDDGDLSFQHGDILR